MPKTARVRRFPYDNDDLRWIDFDVPRRLIVKISRDEEYQFLTLIEAVLFFLTCPRASLVLQEVAAFYEDDDPDPGSADAQIFIEKDGSQYTVHVDGVAMDVEPDSLADFNRRVSGDTPYDYELEYRDETETVVIPVVWP